MTSEQLIAYFEAVTTQMVDVCKKKNADYAGSVDGDVFANFTRVEVLGICST